MDFSFDTVGFDERFQKAIDEMAEKGEVYLVEIEYGGVIGECQSYSRMIFPNVEEIKKFVMKKELNAGCTGVVLDHFWSVRQPMEVYQNELLYESFFETCVTEKILKEMAFVTRLK